MDIWWLHALTFIFGYVTCKTFYFLNTARLSLKLIKSSRIIYLLLAVKAVENYVMSEATMNQHLDKTDQDQTTKDDFKQKSADDLIGFKKLVIRNLLYQTPSAFRPGLEFDDWESAMAHLQHYKAEALEFWRMSE